MGVIKVSYEGQKKPHGYFSNGAYFMLELAESQIEGSYYFLCASLMFSAFTLESYLNYIGQNYISFWPRIEKINALDKLNVVYEYKSMIVKWGLRPYQTISELFKFRNIIAHAKPSKRSGSTTVNEDDFPYFDKKEFWEEYPTVEKTRCVKADVQTIMEEIKAIYKDDSHIMDIGSYHWHGEGGDPMLDDAKHR